MYSIQKTVTLQHRVILSDNMVTVNVTYWNTSLCPAGYICDTYTKQMASCNDIRQKYIDFKFGDVLAGAYCPARNSINDENDIGKIQSCPLGYYCPTTNISKPCPKGYYCPHKSVDYRAIPCNACQEGSTVFKRDKIGTAIFFAAIALSAAYLLYSLFLSLTTRGMKIRKSLEDRRIDAAKRKKLVEEEKARLHKIRPFLENILQNMNQLNNDAVLKDNSRGLSFDVVQFFDLLDVNHDQVLTFDELNKVLKFKDNQLKQFIHRINEMDDENLEEITISRKTFIAHFLNATYHSVNFDPSPEEVSTLYDIIERQQTETDIHHTGGIDIDSLYESELSVFLSDLQIYKIIKYLNDRMLLVEPQSTVNEDKVLKSKKDITRTSMMASKDFIGEAKASDLELGDNLLHQEKTKKSIGSTFMPSYPLAYSKSVRPMLISMKALLSLKSEKNNAFSNTKTKRKVVILTKDEFVRMYPEALFHATHDQTSVDSDGVDVQFDNLSLHIKAGGKSTAVVDNVSGRIRKKAMSALMGGSGAGKTSLLNALCGRAFYGEVSGSIKINGQDTSIKEISDSIGFVPQDDIVFAELTVKENLIFAGKFRLPVGTKDSDIEAIANEALINLGLVRVANSIVGDVTRRGVSGGEKKRVNIGLELMAKPSILFLDEPTSGLDSSSAMLVMKALRTLVERQGVTICSVIHQPRAFIFNLFDAIILLGVGGRMVYHGPTRDALSYFTNLGYTLPEGESVADWLMDISSGQLARSTLNDDGNGTEDDERALHSAFTSHRKLSPVKLQGDTAAFARNFLYDEWLRFFIGLPQEKKQYYEPPTPYDLPGRRKKAGFLTQLKYHLQRNLIISKRNMSTKIIDSFLVIGGVIIASLLVGQLKLTRGTTPPVENEFRLLTQGELSIYGSVLRIMLSTVASVVDCLTFATIVAALAGTLLALCSIKILTEKREEFFREAGSGYNVLSYFVAVNIYNTLEQGLQAVFASLVALWLRNSVCKWWMYVTNFCVLTWGVVSWALLFAILLPPKNVVLMTTFFMVLSALMLSGALIGVKYKDIYEAGNEVLAFVCGILSPARFFVEMMVVSEYRALGPQYGFSLDRNHDHSNFPQNDSMYVFNSLGKSDFSRHWNGTSIAPSIFHQSRDGWYWGVPAAVSAGLSIRILGGIAILMANRAKQIKEPMIRWDYSFKSLIKIKTNVVDQGSLYSVITLFCLFVAVLVLSGYLMF